MCAGVGYRSTGAGFVVTEEQIDSLINAVGEALHEFP